LLSAPDGAGLRRAGSAALKGVHGGMAPLPSGRLPAQRAAVAGNPPTTCNNGPVTAIVWAESETRRKQNCGEAQLWR